MNKHQGKTAVVTGGSSGIGLAAAELLAREGAHVFITGRRKTELDVAVERIGRDVTAIQGDVSKLPDLDRVFAKVKETKGHIDILFANAGIAEGAPLAEITEEHFDRHFDINVKGALFTVQKAPPLLRDGASVILTSSVVGSKGLANRSVYSATKAALRSFRAHVDHGSQGTPDPRERGQPRGDGHTRASQLESDVGRGADRCLPRSGPARPPRPPRRRRRCSVVPGVGREQLHLGHRARSSTVAWRRCEATPGGCWGGRKGVSMSLILVTGATGRHGGTGAYVARRLQQEGHRVRLLSELADMLASELSTPVRYEAITLVERCQDLDDLAKRPEEIVNADMAKHISTLARALSRRSAGRAPDAAALEPLIGRRPLSFREFVRARRGQFINESMGTQSRRTA